MKGSLIMGLMSSAFLLAGLLAYIDGDTGAAFWSSIVIANVWSVGSIVSSILSKEG